MDEIELAKKYYTALYDKDYDQVQRIASSVFRFADPTVQKDVANLPVEKNSLEHFLKYMKESSAGLDAKLIFDDCFHSNNHVVLYVSIEGSVPGEQFGKPQERLKIASRGISVIELKDSRVVGHVDYIDYTQLIDMITSQL